MRTIKLICVWACMYLGSGLFGQPQNGVLSGVVLDDHDAPIANAEVRYHNVPRLTARMGGTKVAAEPLFGASVRTATDGSFLIGGLPAGIYHVCVHGVKNNQLSSCEWQGTKRVDLASGQTAQLKFQLAEGTLLTFHVQDLRNQIRDLADLSAGKDGLAVSGANFGIGVWAGSRYLRAKLVSIGGGIRLYQLAISKAATVRLFLDTPLKIIGLTGTELAARVPSITVAAGGQAEVLTNLTIP